MKTSNTHTQKKTRMLPDFSERERNDVEAAEHRRTDTNSWIAESLWHSLEVASLWEPPNRHEARERPVSSSKALRDQWTRWIDETICPTGLVTILMPHVALGEAGRDHKRQRDPAFYISLLTKQAERRLFGKSSMHVRNQDDRCLWIGVFETEPYLHFHALLRMPTRPMAIERDRGMLPPSDRCRLMQDALLEAAKLTPEAFATGSQLDHLGDTSPADIQVQPYETPRHPRYVFDKLKPVHDLLGVSTDMSYRKTLHDAGLVILPNVLRQLGGPTVGQPSAARPKNRTRSFGASYPFTPEKGVTQN